MISLSLIVYIGINEQNLKIGVWSGKVEFKNLKLKSGVLDPLNLPLSVIHGSLKSLKLKVPWASLDTKPVRVIIDGLYIVASPLDINTLSYEQIKKKAAKDKKDKLIGAQTAILNTNKYKSKDFKSRAISAGSGDENDKNKTTQSTYIQNFVAKIVDNLEIVITNIHVRYEDNVTIRGSMFSAGLTIDTIKLVGVDDLWNEIFVVRDKLGMNFKGMHKLGKVSNLGIYWNIRSYTSASMSVEAREQWLQDLIYKTSTATSDDKYDDMSPANENIAGNGHYNTSSNQNSRQRELTYLLSPPNNLIIKLIHNESPTEDVPLIDLTVEIPDILVLLDRAQYQQLLSLSTGFGRLAHQKQMALYRPPLRPRQDPRAWWKYAYFLVTGKEVSLDKFASLNRSIANKKRYIYLVKVLRDKEMNQNVLDQLLESPATAAASAAALAQEEVELNHIEDILPMQILLRYRQKAAFEMRNEELRLEQEIEKNRRMNIIKSHTQTKTSNTTSATAMTAARNKLTADESHDNKSSFWSSVFNWRAGNANKTKSSNTRNSIDNTMSGQSTLSSSDADDMSLESIFTQLNMITLEDIELQHEHFDITNLRLNFSSNAVIKLTMSSESAVVPRASSTSADTPSAPLAQLEVAVKAAIEAKVS